MKSTLEITREARDKIALRRNWIKGEMDRGCRHCAYGAVLAALNENWSDDFDRDRQLVFQEIKDTFRSAIYAEHADRTNSANGFHPLIVFNDHRDTTHEDVVALFDQVIETLELRQ